MGKKVKPADTLGILEAIVEKRAEFKQWGPFSDIEIMDWTLTDNFIPDFTDASYVNELKNAMLTRVKAVEDFSTKKSGYDALPEEALAALKKIVAEIETI